MFFFFFLEFSVLFKLKKYFSGIKNISTLPNIVIVIGQKKEIIAVKECLKLGVTLITITDTDCDPLLTDYFIPANDDSVLSVGFILNELCKYINTK